MAATDLVKISSPAKRQWTNYSATLSFKDSCELAFASPPASKVIIHGLSCLLANGVDPEGATLAIRTGVAVHVDNLPLWVLVRSGYYELPHPIEVSQERAVFTFKTQALVAARLHGQLHLTCSIGRP